MIMHTRDYEQGSAGGVHSAGRDALSYKTAVLLRAGRSSETVRTTRPKKTPATAEKREGLMLRRRGVLHFLAVVAVALLFPGGIHARATGAPGVTGASGATSVTGSPGSRGASVSTGSTRSTGSTVSTGSTGSNRLTGAPAHAGARVARTPAPAGTTSTAAALWHWLADLAGLAPKAQPGHGAPVRTLGGGCPNPDGGPCT